MILLSFCNGMRCCALPAKSSGRNFKNDFVICAPPDTHMIGKSFVLRLYNVKKMSVAAVVLAQTDITRKKHGADRRHEIIIEYHKMACLCDFDTKNIRVDELNFS